MGVSMGTVRALRDRGHDAVHLREEGLHRLPDPDILAKAVAENRVVLTFDLDFGDLLAAGRHALPRTVIFRLQDARPAAVERRLLPLLRSHGKTLASGAIAVVEESRFRLRSLPIE